MNHDVVLLTGFQRSGTTGLGLALAQAYAERGDVFTVNGKLAYLLRRWLTEADLEARHLRSDEIEHALLRRPPLGPAASTWLDATRAALAWAAAEVAEGTWDGGAAELAGQVLARSYGGERPWGEKYNESMLDLPALVEAVPGVRVVLLHRDPAEVVGSMLEWTGDRPWRPTGTAAVIAKWRAWNDRALADLAAAGVEHLVVDYAAICGEAGARRRVADFVGVPVAALDHGLRRSGRTAPAVAIDEAAEATRSRLQEREG